MSGKCLGRKGFKDLVLFNDALLGLQAWSLIREPYTLFGKVIKAKYYPILLSSMLHWVTRLVFAGKVFDVLKHL